MMDEERITKIATVRMTKLAPAAFLESNPGGDRHVAERFSAQSSGTTSPKGHRTGPD